MTHKEIADLIHELRPGAIWVLNGDTYEGLIWMDGIQLKPSWAEILDRAGR